MLDMVETVFRLWSRKVKWKIEDGLLLHGLMALFRATNDPQYRQLMMDFMDATVSENGAIQCNGILESPWDPASCGNALFYAWKETGEKRYQIALHNNLDHIQADPSAELPVELYGNMPFLAEYDTLFGGKQAYKAIAQQIRKCHDQLFDTEKGLYRTPVHQNEDGFSLRDEGLMLLTLIETIDQMDMQIYEHYRALADLFLIAAKGVVCWQDQNTRLLHSIIDQKETEIDWGGNAMIIYALRKGVKLGLLDEEKYLPLVKQAYSHLAEYLQSCKEPFDEWIVGPFMMARAEMWEEE